MSTWISQAIRHWNLFDDFRISRSRNIKMSFEITQYLAGLENPRGCKNPSVGTLVENAWLEEGWTITYSYDYLTARKSCDMTHSRFSEPMNSFIQEYLQSNFEMAVKIHYAIEINQKDLVWLIFDLAKSRIRKNCFGLTWEAYILTIHFVIILLLQLQNDVLLCQW